MGMISVRLNITTPSEDNSDSRVAFATENRIKWKNPMEFFTLCKRGKLVYKNSNIQNLERHPVGRPGEPWMILSQWHNLWHKTVVMIAYLSIKN